ncbi:hypothetical protein Cgig2_030222 [Carnegiea gigantea]|uniref:Uncharacterized protein n=1 Tax=Carnegiea gigantea TaxID=171969 RepID=A0A9Q1GQY0_9CARY|nr:hypothetical protein Cgig2_030222 [Carnegiea gigantea]
MSKDLERLGLLFVWDVGALVLVRYNEATEYRCASSGEKMEGSKEQYDERKRVPVEVKGRYKRRKAAGDGVVIGDDPGWGSLLGPLHVEAIKGTLLKRILQYQPFGLRRELTLAFVRQWVPSTGKRVKFDGKEVSDDFGRMVMEHMAEAIVAEAGKWKCQKEWRRSLTGLDRVQDPLLYRDLRLEKENRKSLDREAEKLASHVHDLEGRLQKYEHISKYLQPNDAPTAADDEQGCQLLTMFVG